jgi:cytosine deaminase
MGADLVGGCPYNDSDGLEHIRIVFALATAFGVDVDFHVDFTDEPRHLHVREIAAHTVRVGWQGRVAVGHPTELAAVPGFRQDEIIAEIAAAGLGVICLPATDLYLMGRQDDSNVRRGSRRSGGCSRPACPWRSPPTTSATRSLRWAPPTSATWRS